MKLVDSLIESNLFKFNVLSKNEFNIELNYSTNSTSMIKLNSTDIKTIEIISENFYLNPLIYVTDFTNYNLTKIQNESRIEIFGIFKT